MQKQDTLISIGTTTIPQICSIFFARDAVEVTSRALVCDREGLGKAFVKRNPSGANMATTVVVRIGCNITEVGGCEQFSINFNRFITDRARVSCIDNALYTDRIRRQRSAAPLDKVQEKPMEASM